MITLDVRGLAEVQAALRQLATQQMPYAISSAINTTAYQVMRAERTEIKRVFDRPTPFVQRGIRYDKATKKTLTATVYAAPESAKSLIHNVEGTPRKTKTYEAMMRNAGVLPAGRYVVPGAGAKMDRYGNIDSNQLAAILSKLGLLSAESAAKGGKRRAKAIAQAGSYFVGGKAGSRLFPGIYQRKASGRGIRPILIFVTKTTYQPRYRFIETARNEVIQKFPENFDKAFRKAMQTAR